MAHDTEPGSGSSAPVANPSGTEKVAARDSDAGAPYAGAPYAEAPDAEAVGTSDVLAPGGVTRPDALTLLGFAAMVVFAAGNVIAVRYMSREIPPFWGAGTRFAAASALFFLYMLIKRVPLPRGAALANAVIFGVLQFGVGLALGYWALQRVTAGVASVVLATVPIFTLAFAAVARLERLHLRGVLGALLALTGIALMLRGQLSADTPLPYLLAAIGLAVCIALSSVLVKKLPQGHPAATNAVAMLVGAAIVLGLSFLRREPHPLPTDSVIWAAQVYLVLLGSVGLFGLFLVLLKRWTATGLSYQLVLTPIVAIGLSAWLLDEPVTSGLLLATVLVVAGVYVGALLPGRRAECPAQEPHC